MTYKERIIHVFGPEADVAMQQAIKKLQNSSNVTLFKEPLLSLGVSFACQIKEREPHKTLEMAVTEGFGMAAIFYYQGGSQNA